MTFARLLEPAASTQDLPATEAFADLRAHVARLDLPETETVDWVHVHRTAQDLLTQQGKDLLLASYAAFAPLALGPNVLPHTAVAFLTRFIDTYWETMSPPKARPRARANCIAWFVARMKTALSALLSDMGTQDRHALRQAWQAFSQTLRARLGACAPNTSAVLRLIEGAALPPSNATLQASQPTVALPSAEPARQSKAPEAPDCRALARGLCLLAQQRRQHDPLDMQAARLWRVGLWLNVHTTPELLGDVTRVTPVPADIRARLTQMQLSCQWTQLHSVAEQAMFAHPLALDLQYFAATALTQMGGAQLLTSEMVRSETQALCRRIPGLLGLKAADGTALAMRETIVWLCVQSPQLQADAAGPPVGSAPVSRARHRFRQRLKSAERALAEGHIDVAEAAFDGLSRLVGRHKLNIWEPSLARRVLGGHLAALRQQTPPELARVRGAFRRWAVLACKRAQAQTPQPTLPLGKAGR